MLGHLPNAYHFDPDLLLNPNKLSKIVDSLYKMQHEYHFCFMSESWLINPTQKMLNLFFIQKKILNISVIVLVVMKHVIYIYKINNQVIIKSLIII